MVRAYEDLLGVEVLTHCVMSNHFHLLVRVPHRPADFDLPLEVLVARMERALGEDAMGLLRKQLEFWQRAGLDSLIEQWRKFNSISQLNYEGNQLQSNHFRAILLNACCASFSF